MVFSIMKRLSWKADALQIQEIASSGDKVSALQEKLKQQPFVRESVSYTLQYGPYFIDIHLTNSPKIIVTFESGGFDKAGARHREAWGGGYFRHKDISYIGIKTTANNWYVAPSMGEFLEGLQYILSEYDEVITYGSSMGGFAALTYANVLNATKVIAFCPQSCRHPDICPWETPAPNEVAKMDPDDPYTDSVGNYTSAQEVFIFADMLDERDRRHVERLRADNVTIINTPHIAHSIPTYLHALGLLYSIPIQVIDGTFSPQSFHKNFRKRRTLRRYYSILEGRVSHRPKLLDIVKRNKKLGKVGPA